MKKTLSFFYFILFLSVFAQGQSKIDSNTVIQFSGLVVTEYEGEIIPLPYTNISVFGSSRGTITNENGFFSIAGLIGEEFVFSYISYETVSFTIPDTLSSNVYSIVQIMTKDSVLLPEAVIYPWPSRTYFDIEFLALDVNDEMRERAEKNVAEKAMAQMRKQVGPDGAEAAKFEMQQQAAAYYSYGQFNPTNLLNPLAWKKFIEAWKRGDFKRKDEEE